MSKLDYVTIAIVGICILAIAFLVFKMTNVFNDGKETEKVQSAADVEAEDDATYDYSIDDTADSTGGQTGTGSPSSDNTPASKPATSSATADAAETSASDAGSEDGAKEPIREKPSIKTPGTTATTTDTAAEPSSGKYMVIAGSFKVKESAEKQVSKLHKLGYDNSRVEIFDRGKYAIVLVDRFDNMADAEKLVKKLSASGVNSYVKAKE